MSFLASYRSANPHLTLKQCMQQGSVVYRRGNGTHAYRSFQNEDKETFLPLYKIAMRIIHEYEKDGAHGRRNWAAISALKTMFKDFPQLKNELIFITADNAAHGRFNEVWMKEYMSDWKDEYNETIQEKFGETWTPH